MCNLSNIRCLQSAELKAPYCIGVSMTRIVESRTRVQVKVERHVSVSGIRMKVICCYMSMLNGEYIQSYFSSLHWWTRFRTTSVDVGSKCDFVASVLYDNGGDIRSCRKQTKLVKRDS